VYEIAQDESGAFRTYCHTFNVRELYKHVVSAITCRHEDHDDDCRHKHASKSKKKRTAAPPRCCATRHERLGGYLHPRDMRRFVTMFSASNEHELIVRRHVMLFCYDPVRAIVLRDRVLIIIPQGEDAILNRLKKKLLGKSSDAGETIVQDKQTIIVSKSRVQANNDILGGTKHDERSLALPSETIVLQQTDVEADQATNATDDDANNDDSIMDEYDEMRGDEWIVLPFELQCADGILACVGEDSKRRNILVPLHKRRVLVKIQSQFSAP
jgi:hypothetical protein